MTTIIRNLIAAMLLIEASQVDLAPLAPVALLSPARLMRSASMAR